MFVEEPGVLHEPLAQLQLGARADAVLGHGSHAGQSQPAYFRSTPKVSRLRLASMAPVAKDGIRPCTELKLCERLMKYAGLFDEHPMPLSLATRSGWMPISYMASMMRSEMALCPHPAHSVVLPPLYSMTDSPMRLIFGAGLVGVVDILLALHGHDFVSYRARIERQAVNMTDAQQPCYQLRPNVELQQAQHLRIC